MDAIIRERTPGLTISTATPLSFLCEIHPAQSKYSQPHKKLIINKKITRIRWDKTNEHNIIFATIRAEKCYQIILNVVIRKRHPNRAQH